MKKTLIIALLALILVLVELVVWDPWRHNDSASIDGASDNIQVSLTAPSVLKAASRAATAQALKSLSIPSSAAKQNTPQEQADILKGLQAPTK